MAGCKISDEEMAWREIARADLGADPEDDGFEMPEREDNRPAHFDPEDYDYGASRFVMVFFISVILFVVVALVACADQQNQSQSVNFVPPKHCSFSQTDIIEAHRFLGTARGNYEKDEDPVVVLEVAFDEEDDPEEMVITLVNGTTGNVETYGSSAYGDDEILQMRVQYQPGDAVVTDLEKRGDDDLGPDDYKRLIRKQAIELDGCKDDHGRS